MSAGLAIIGMKWDMNTHHAAFSRFVIDGGGAPATLTQIQNAWDAIADAFTAERAWCSSSTALTQLTYQGMEFVSAPGGYRFHPTTLELFQDVAISGSGASTAAPPQVAYRATLRTLLPGKSYRGRIFLPSPPEGSVDANGAITSTAVLSAQDFLTNARTDVDAAIAASSNVISVPSFKNGTTTELFDILVRDIVGTQRRRLKATTV